MFSLYSPSRLTAMLMAILSCAANAQQLTVYLEDSTTDSTTRSVFGDELSFEHAPVSWLADSVVLMLPEGVPHNLVLQGFVDEGEPDDYNLFFSLDGNFVIMDGESPFTVEEEDDANFLGDVFSQGPHIFETTAYNPNSNDVVFHQARYSVSMTEIPASLLQGDAFDPEEDDVLWWNYYYRTAANADRQRFQHYGLVASINGQFVFSGIDFEAGGVVEVTGFEPAATCFGAPSDTCIGFGYTLQQADVGSDVVVVPGWNLLSADFGFSLIPEVFDNNEDDPTQAPTGVPTVSPTEAPSGIPSDAPSLVPSGVPSDAPSLIPSSAPSESPIASPTGAPSESPIASPTVAPTEAPVRPPVVEPNENVGGGGGIRSRGPRA